MKMGNGEWAMGNNGYFELPFRVVQRLIPRYLVHHFTIGTAKRNTAPVSIGAPSAVYASWQLPICSEHHIARKILNKVNKAASAEGLLCAGLSRLAEHLVGTRPFGHFWGNAKSDKEIK